MLVEHEQRQLRLGGLPEIRTPTHDKLTSLFARIYNVSFRGFLEGKAKIVRRPRPDRVLASPGTATPSDIIAAARGRFPSIS
jgi:hypothetical protein